MFGKSFFLLRYVLIYKMLDMGFSLSYKIVSNVDEASCVRCGCCGCRVDF